MTRGHVFLIGFMGAGKSTVGRLLSERVRMPFVDLDSVIEQGAQASVSELFASRGEEGFRALETEALASLAACPPSVVACGGGVVLRPENRTHLHSLGTVVYLRVTAGEAVARVGDASTRPLLAGGAGTLAATSLLAAREALYKAAADITVDTVGRLPEQVADEIFDSLKESAS